MYIKVFFVIGIPTHTGSEASRYIMGTLLYFISPKMKKKNSKIHLADKHLKKGQRVKWNSISGGVTQKLKFNQYIEATDI